MLTPRRPVEGSGERLSLSFLFDAPEFGAPNTNRTCDLPLRRRLLYPLSYRGVAGILAEKAFRDPETKMAGHAGHRFWELVERRRIELQTFALRTRRSPS